MIQSWFIFVGDHLLSKRFGEVSVGMSRGQNPSPVDEDGAYERRGG